MELVLQKFRNDLPEEVNKLIGKNSFTDQSPIMIQKGLWQNFCSSIEDGNKIYWDERVAECHTEDLIAHPAMLPSWVHDFEWHPQRKKVQPMELHFHLKNILNLPLGIVTEVDIEYYLPIKDGDAISANQTLLSVSEKHIHLARKTYLLEHNTVWGTTNNNSRRKWSNDYTVPRESSLIG